MNPSSQNSEEVSDELLDHVIAILQVAEGERLSIKKDLRRVGKQFVASRSIQPFYASPREQRAAIRLLRKQIERLAHALTRIAPEYAVALHVLAKLPTGNVITIELEQLLLSLHAAATEFEENFSPPMGPPVDWPLEEAVRELAEIVQNATGDMPSPSMNKWNDANPDLKRPGARAVSHLLRALDPNLTKTKIANMLLKVANQPQASETALDSLIRLQTDEQDLWLRPKSD